MRIAVKKTKVFKFNELTEEQKQKAIEKLFDLNVDYDWWESTYEDAENIGLKITGFELDRYCKGDFMGYAEETAKKIKENHGKTCETYKTAVSYLQDRKKLIKDNPADEYGEFTYETDNLLHEMDREFLRSLLEDYRIMLSKEYEYQTSEKAIIETIEANEYEFTEEGKIY